MDKKEIQKIIQDFPTIIKVAKIMATFIVIK